MTDLPATPLRDHLERVLAKEADARGVKVTICPHEPRSDTWRLHAWQYNNPGTEVQALASPAGCLVREDMLGAAGATAFRHVSEMFARAYEAYRPSYQSV